jgi:hypothetical protein
VTKEKDSSLHTELQQAQQPETKSDQVTDKDTSTTHASTTPKSLVPLKQHGTECSALEKEKEKASTTQPAVKVSNGFKLEVTVASPEEEPKAQESAPVEEPKQADITPEQQVEGEASSEKQTAIAEDENGSKLEVTVVSPEEEPKAQESTPVEEPKQADSMPEQQLEDKVSSEEPMVGFSTAGIHVEVGGDMVVVVTVAQVPRAVLRPHFCEVVKETSDWKL